MFDVFKDSVILFFRGKLFQDMSAAIRQAVIGILATALACIILVKLGMPLLPGVLIAALIGGGLQPYLFKDLKYR
jgi:hypothetical protein